MELVEHEPTPKEWTIPWNIFREIELRGGYICGGFARWIATPNKYKNYVRSGMKICNSPQDIDVYPLNENTENVLLHYLNDISVSSWRTGHTYNPFDTEVFKFPNTNNSNEIYKIQLIKENYGTPKDIIQNFDFTVCQAFLNSFEKRVLTPNYWYSDEKNEALRINKKYTHDITVYRLDKYIRKGYQIRDYKSFTEIFNLFAKTSGEKLAWVFYYTLHVIKDYELWKKIHTMANMTLSPKEIEGLPKWTPCPDQRPLKVEL